MSRCLYSSLLFASFVIIAPGLASAESGYRIIRPTDRSAPVSMELQDADIQSALKIVAEIKNANIAFQRDVNGNVRSFSVSGVPAAQVFNTLLRMKGLFAVEEGNVVIVYKIEDYIRDATARRALRSE